MVGEVWGGEEEEELDGFGVEGGEGDARKVAAEDEQGAFEDAGHGVSGVGQGDAVADGGGVEFFAVEQALEEGFLLSEVVAGFGDERDEFTENGGFVRSFELKLNLLGTEQFRKIRHGTNFAEVWRISSEFGKEPALAFQGPQNARNRLPARRVYITVV